MPKTVILSAARTPIGKLGGGLASLDATELGGTAIKAALERADVAPEQVDHVIMGQVIQAGQGQIPSRQAQIKAGLPKELSSETINKVCASGIRAAALLDTAIRAGDLKVGVGLMCRHCEVRGELFDRIQDGQIGDIVLLRAYRQAGPVGSALVEPRPSDVSELSYQIMRFHGFLWASGGCFSDFLIHNIDECCWMKDGWPVSAGRGAAP